jgi:small GTP-binding protein
MSDDPGGPPSRKVVFLGDTGVGKTSILGFHEKGVFQPAATTTSPSCVRYPFSSDKHTISLNFWDTAGQEKFRSMANLYIRNAFAVILVFDVTALESYNHLENWMEMCHQSDPSPRVYFIVGNKIDLGPHRKVDHTDAERWAASNNASYLEVSALTGECIAELFAAVGEGVLDVLYDKGLDENVELGLDPGNTHGKKGKCCC